MVKNLENKIKSAILGTIAAGFVVGGTLMAYSTIRYMNPNLEKDYGFSRKAATYAGVAGSSAIALGGALILYGLTRRIKNS